MLSNKTIVVTGAAAGIGAESARIIKSQGASVIGLDKHEARGVDRFVHADLSDPASIDAAINAIGPSIDGLCNIAGLPPTAPEEQVVKVNFLGLKRLTLGMIDKLNDGASIVNMASLAGSGWPESVTLIKEFIANGAFSDVGEFCSENEIIGGRSYFFSKEVLVVWTMMNRWTWRDRGIRMNCISPGPVDTAILPDFMETLGERAEEDMKIMGRAGTPEDIAPLVAFLCSDQSVWIRGTNMPCDGGMFSHIMMNQHGVEA